MHSTSFIVFWPDHQSGHMMAIWCPHNHQRNWFEIFEFLIWTELINNEFKKLQVSSSIKDTLCTLPNWASKIGPKMLSMLSKEGRFFYYILTETHQSWSIELKSVEFKLLHASSSMKYTLHTVLTSASKIGPKMLSMLSKKGGLFFFS